MKNRVFLLLTALILIVTGCKAAPTTLPQPAWITSLTPTIRVATVTQKPTALTPTSTTTPAQTGLPPVQELPTGTVETAFDLISTDSLLAYISDLSAIQPYSGWRNSGTQGEVEAFDYVAQKLEGFTTLKNMGLRLERQAFPVYLVTELWDTGLDITVSGQELHIPADGLRGSRFNIDLALNFDSDGKLNDSDRNPVSLAGSTVLIRNEADLAGLTLSETQGKVIFMDFALVDNSLFDPRQCRQRAEEALAKKPAGLVIVTRFSNVLNESHGTFIGDGGIFQQLDNSDRVPLLAVRLEDLAPAGIQELSDLTRIEQARLTWDADVFSPGKSGNLAAFIPGSDSSKAIIVGAHIDSPNNPGAMDDGSGSAILLEIARVLNDARLKPPVDVVLVWFGSEELLLQGSAYFADTHQELLDQTLGVLTVDDLTRPVEGAHSTFGLYTWSSSRVGGQGPVFAQSLAELSAKKGIETYPIDRKQLYSDNSSFAGFGVPNADLILTDSKLNERYDDHYLGHMHDPYDTPGLAKEMSKELQQMAVITLSAVLELPTQAQNRISPPAKSRALFLGNHTEYVHISPVDYNELGMALTQQALDVDFIPFGQKLTGSDLQGTRLVIALPACNYSNGGEGAGWSQEETDLLNQYVNDGGFLVLTNTAACTDILNRPIQENGDAQAANSLAQRFGLEYQVGKAAGDIAFVNQQHPLVNGMTQIIMVKGGAIPLVVKEGQILAKDSTGQPVMALVGAGANGGQVLALSDVSMLGSINFQAGNLPFWKNMASYAAER
ncbi:MAG: M28 family metallopeptidase [Omnitrophica WOR_2 bacterium]